MAGFFPARPELGPYLMGIVNVTPDSFSDGGAFQEPRLAIEQGLRLVAEGADILDIGGESTRPGATPVPATQEIDRVLPVIEGLRGCGALISIDSRNAATMRAAIAAGAGMINDVSALAHDPESLAVVRSHGGPVCLMHMQGSPVTMQRAPQYGDVVAEVSASLRASADRCIAAGIDRARIVVDPGIGFGKTLQHNLELLRGISVIGDLGYPVLAGVSRKSFIERICPGAGPGDRLAGSLAAGLRAAAAGVRILRVHDVAATRQALRVDAALK